MHHTVYQTMPYACMFFVCFEILAWAAWFLDIPDSHTQVCGKVLGAKHFNSKVLGAATSGVKAGGMVSKASIGGSETA
jgi:hypothetical protein